MRRHCLAPVRFETTENPFDPSLPNRQKKNHAMQKKKGSKRKTLQQSSMRRRPPTERVERCRVVVFVVIVVFWPFLGGWVFRDPARVPVKKASFFFLGFRLWFSFCQFRAEVFFFLAGGEDWVRVERRRRRDETTAASRPEEGIKKKKP